MRAGKQGLVSENNLKEINDGNGKMEAKVGDRGRSIHVEEKAGLREYWLVC